MTHYDVFGGAQHTLCGGGGDTTGNPSVVTCPWCVWELHLSSKDNKR